MSVSASIVSTATSFKPLPCRAGHLVPGVYQILNPLTSPMFLLKCFFPLFTFHLLFSTISVFSVSSSLNKGTKYELNFSAIFIYFIIIILFSLKKNDTVPLLFTACFYVSHWILSFFPLLNSEILPIVRLALLLATTRPFL